ncbi:HAD-IA family hydrolase [Pseudoxanthomonas sp. CAU 1598]|uniref:HAD-IA family hydrolase n=1 Tax=Pseudomarimonas arenosa TaxID=2774145 RepID=A0AAW3ZJU2_9GAMM|nr:HAD-IA family hydrolase [Pseudomarimonas arenosa]MBD8525489.1 HAD-IA family hydrolase [Pseudomarimonas arenosa]
MIRAITLDLDDTLWPIAPVIERAEHAVQAYFAEYCPEVAKRFPITAMRALRERIAAQHPHLSHDFSEQRRLSLRAALDACAAPHAHLEPAFEAFFSARNQVELYPDSEAALRLLAARFPLAALTNGNADLGRIGLAEWFCFSLGAREHGAPKPVASIFLAACDRLNTAPEYTLHVGDDPWLDVEGARAAGLRTCWINRHNSAWPATLPPPDWQVDSLDKLHALLQPSQADYA